MRVRKALLPDGPAIFGLIFEYSRDGQSMIIPRSLPEIYENIRDFTVVEHKKEIIGCGALHIYGRHLAELRSIAVSPRYTGLGAGRALIDAILAEARYHHIACTCLFTRIPAYFARLGFKKIKKERLPDKFYKDCRQCRKRNCCDEIAMARGRLPAFVTLEEPRKTVKRSKGAEK